MNRITLRQLRYFDALARNGHFGRAAEASAVTQPALSMQIKELEEALGAVLVERSGRRARLTRFGTEAAAGARAILRSVDALGEMARASRDGLSGRFRIGMIPTIAPYLLPAVIGTLAESHPEIEMQVREAVTSKLIHEVKEARLDAAVLALPVSESALTEVPLFTENFLLVRPARDEGAPMPSPAALRDMRLLLLEEGHCFRDQALAFCHRRTSPSRETLDASSLSTLVQMVSAGLGVTLIPEMAVALETRSAAVAVAGFKDPQPSRTVGMIWRKASPLSGQLRQLSEVVRRAAGASCEPRKANSSARKRRT
jgi:LysR family transcriptional regulator, hydrogen peroxide-inducible genes activator